MNVVEKVNGPWLYCMREHTTKNSNYKLQITNYKLHVALPITFFDAYHQSLYEILIKAVKNGVIPAFKMLNSSNSAKLAAELGNENTTIEENPNARLINNPFTIYLYENYNAVLVANLCRQIEGLLQNTPKSNRDHLSIADLELSSHLTFRQENLADKYIAIAHAKPQELEQLRKETESSNEYVSLRKALESGKHGTPEINKDAEHENFIQGFYQKNYAYYDNELKSAESVKQARAACDILSIDFEKLTSEKEADNWLKIINTAYRKASLKFHPDRILTPQSPSTKEYAAAIFNLVQSAQDILKAIAANPSIIKKSELLEQEKYKPQYQYELLNGYSDDPYDYIRMANSSHYYLLVQNYDYIFHYQPINNDKLSPQSAIQIARPELIIYQPHARKQLKIPGYQAFYYLFLAGALPRRFDQGHLRMALDGKNCFTPESCWLVKQFLTTPELINSLDSGDLYSFSIQATQKGFLQIGTTATEVFLYFYKNYPETLYGKRISKLINYKDFDIIKAYSEILKYPQNLAKLAHGSLDELIKYRQHKEFLFDKTVLNDNEINSINLLRRYIFDNSALTVNLTKYRLCDDIVKPILEKRSLNEFYSLALIEIINENNQLISLMSTTSLADLKLFIIQNNEQFFDSPLPSLLIDAINDELYAREQRKDRNLSKQEALVDDLKFDAHQYIKASFLDGKTDILRYLSQEALMWLAAEPEVHWSDYLPVAEALIHLGEEDAALTYLYAISDKLDIQYHNKSATACLIELKKQQHLISNISKEEKNKQIKILLEEYEQILRGTLDSNKDVCYKKLKSLGCEKNAGKISQTIRDELKEAFYGLVDRLKLGERTEALRAEFKKLQFKFSLLSPDSWSWEHFSEKDKEEKWLVGGQLFILFENAIGVTSYERKKYSNFGIKLEQEGLITSLKNIFYLYDCLGAKQEFFKRINEYAKPSNQIDTDNFDEEIIKKTLLDYVRNEFAVYIEGQREDVSYKQNSYFDNQDIKKYAALNSLYVRLGEEEQLQKMLPEAYKKLLDAEKGYKPSAYQKKDLNRPLLKYIEIRKFQKLKNPILEHAAILLQLHAIIQNQLGEGFIPEQRDAFLSLRNKVIDYYHSSSLARNTFSIEDIIKENHHVFKLLAVYLSKYNNQPLLKALQKDPILGEYLGLDILDDEQLSDKKTMKALAKSLKEGTYSQGLHKALANKPEQSIFMSAIAYFSPKALSPVSAKEQASIVSAQTIPTQHDTSNEINCVEIQSVDLLDPKKQISNKEANNNLIKTPASYKSLWSNEKNDTEATLAILKDYYKGNSWPLPTVALIFTGHWNRHHIATVSLACTKKADSAQKILLILKDALLKAGAVVDPEGSLGRRIAFIQYKINKNVIDLDELNKQITDKCSHNINL